MKYYEYKSINTSKLGEVAFCSSQGYHKYLRVIALDLPAQKEKAREQLRRGNGPLTLHPSSPDRLGHLLVSRRPSVACTHTWRA